jgi:hypothetical protein
MQHGCWPPTPSIRYKRNNRNVVEIFEQLGDRRISAQISDMPRDLKYAGIASKLEAGRAQSDESPFGTQIIIPSRDQVPTGGDQSNSFKSL